MLKSKLILLCGFVFLIGLVSSVIDPLIYYKVDLYYNNGEISNLKNEIIFSNEEIINFPGNYKISLLDSGNKEINSDSFIVPLLVHFDEVDDEGNVVGGGDSELSETDFVLYIPYDKDGEKIVIFDNNSEEILKIDVKLYSEDEVNRINEGDIDKDNIIEVSEGNEKSGKNTGLVIFLVIVLVILLVIAIFLILNKKNGKRN